MSSPRLLPAKLDDIEDHDRDDREHQDHCDRAGVAELAVAAVHLEVHPVGDHFGPEVFGGHHIDDIKYFERVDHHRRHNHSDRWHQYWDDNSKEHLDLMRAVHAGRFDQLARDAFQRGGQHHHAEASPDPDAHDD